MYISGLNILLSDKFMSECSNSVDLTCVRTNVCTYLTQTGCSESHHARTVKFRKVNLHFIHNLLFLPISYWYIDGHSFKTVYFLFIERESFAHNFVKIGVSDIDGILM